MRAPGVKSVRVLRKRAAASVAAPIHATEIIQFDHDGSNMSEVITDEGRVPLPPFLAESDIVVNCTLQRLAGRVFRAQPPAPSRARPAGAGFWRIGLAPGHAGTGHHASLGGRVEADRAAARTAREGPAT